MFDSTNPRGEVLDKISEMIDNSIPKQEIFQKIKSEYPQYDEDVIARAVASHVGDDVKKKNMVPVYLLSFLILIWAIFNFYGLFINPPQEMPAYYWTTALIFAIVSIFFVKGFLRFKLFYFTTAVSIYSILVLFIILGLLFYEINLQLIVETAYTLLCLIYLILLRKSLFPSINFWGNVKKEDGSYRF